MKYVSSTPREEFRKRTICSCILDVWGFRSGPTPAICQRVLVTKKPKRVIPQGRGFAVFVSFFRGVAKLLLSPASRCAREREIDRSIDRLARKKRTQKWKQSRMDATPTTLAFSTFFGEICFVPRIEEGERQARKCVIPSVVVLCDAWLAIAPSSGISVRAVWIVDCASGSIARWHSIRCAFFGS